MFLELKTQQFSKFYLKDAKIKLQKVDKKKSLNDFSFSSCN